MKQHNKPLFTIFLIVFVDLLGFGIVLPLLPYIAEKYQASPFTIGILGATYSFFQLIAGPLLGRLSDRFGRKKLLAISQAGSAVGYLILGLAHNLPLLFLARIIDGITGGNISIAQAYIADITTKENRAKGMGIIGAAFGLGFIFGPAIGGFLAKYSYSYPGFFAMGISILTVILTIFTLPETVSSEERKNEPKAQVTIKEFWKIASSTNIQYLIVVFFLFNSAFSMMQGTFALWTQKRFNFGPEQNGYVFAFVGVMAVIAQLKLLPMLVKRFKERTLLNYSTLFFGLGFIMIPLVPNYWYLMITQALIVFGNSMANPSIQALASESVPKEDYGETLGFLQSAGSLGRIVGPVLGGWLFGALGIDSPFFFAAFVILIIFFYLQKKK
jgi:DHA1 family tetracycline resistance protein-like MFS transporter